MTPPHHIDSSPTIVSHVGETWRTKYGSHALIGGLVALFVIMRLPATLLAPGAQDEEWYGIPGLTVAEEGIPRVPYSRPDEPESLFFGADEMLFAEPPLSFYAQAPFFLCLPATYGTARLASFVSGCFSIVLVYLIGQSLFRDARISLMAAGLYSLSRLCFFPAMVARPDMLCGTLGLLALYLLCEWNRSPTPRRLLACGFCLGLAGLTHPFAIIFAMQLTVGVLLLRGNTRDRFKRLALFSLGVLASFSLWIPLIVQRPDLFRAQFIGNILRPAGPGLLSRFVFPFESFAHQIPPLVDRAHPIQFGMLAFALVASGWIAIRQWRSAIAACWLLAASSIYFLVACLDAHPIQGFWCYSAGLCWLLFAFIFFAGCDWACTGSRRVRLVALGVVIVVTAMLPGSGIRTIATYAIHGNDDLYSSPRFIRILLADLPPESTVTVGPEFALDAYGEGRHVLLACRHPDCFDSALHPTDFYIFGRRDFAENMPQAYRCEFVKAYGNRDNVFSNYAEVYRRVE